MALSTDRFSLLLYEMSKEFRFFEDVLLTCGLYYVTKTSFSLCFSAYNGFREHIWAKISRVDLPSTVGKWAVVSGVSKGPGRAFAEELARRGMNIILVDDNEEWVETIVFELEQEFSVSVKSVVVSFQDGNINRNYDLLEVIGKSDIGILVNSYQVGMIPAHYDSLNVDQIKSFIMANVFSASALISMILPGMLFRDRGVILNLTTLPGLLPVPLFATLSSTKAYIETLSDCLRMELRGTNIHVCSLTHGISRPDVMSPNYSPILYMCPTVQTMVQNTIDALLISPKISGGIIPSIQVWMMKRVPFWMYKYFAYGIVTALYIRRRY